MTDPIRTLALSVSRCPEITRARADAAHPCRQIVNLQPDDPDVYQVPEGWAGNLLDGRIVFASSNPSISEAGDAQSGGVAEDYPTWSWDDEEIAHFVTERFAPRGYANAAGQFRRQDGTWSKPVAFWNGVRNRATELLGRPADPANDYVMTEVVHCKSKREKGVKNSASHCAERHLDRIIEASPADLIVVLGAKARNLLVPEWDLPSGFGQKATVGRDEEVNLVRRPVGGRERLVSFLWHPSGMAGPKTFPGAYPTRLPELQRLVTG